MRSLIGALIITFVSACASSPEPVIGPVVAVPAPELGQNDYAAFAAENYKLRPADVLSVNVFREPDLSVNQLPIGADGYVSLPLVGGIRVAGLTTVELEREVRGRLASGYIKHPQVSVNVLKYGSHQVTVEGAVEEPGVYDFKPGARLSSAMALASGPTRVAKLDQVVIFRKIDSQMQIAKFDYTQVIGGTMMDPVIEPGDRIVVGTSGLARFWQDALTALPAFAIFTNVAR